MGKHRNDLLYVKLGRHRTRILARYVLGNPITKHKVKEYSFLRRLIFRSVSIESRFGFMNLEGTRRNRLDFPGRE
jgi:hypothetical protein